MVSAACAPISAKPVSGLFTLSSDHFIAKCLLTIATVAYCFTHVTTVRISLASGIVLLLPLAVPVAGAQEARNTDPAAPISQILRSPTLRIWWNKV
jgi:hypothetical protein